MPLLPSLLLLTLFLIGASSAQNASYFIYPPASGANVTKGVTVELKWISNAGSAPISLSFIPQIPAGAFPSFGGRPGSSPPFTALLLTNVSDPGNFSFPATPPEQVPLPASVKFQVEYHNASHNVSFTSGLLTIVESSNTTNASSPTTSSTVSPQTSFSQDQNTGSSTTALHVGLGVGLGVGIPFLLLVGGLAGYCIFRRSRPKPKNAEAENGSDDTPSAPVPEASGENEIHEAMDREFKPPDHSVEASEESAIHEAPGIVNVGELPAALAAEEKPKERAKRHELPA